MKNLTKLTGIGFLLMLVCLTANAQNPDLSKIGTKLNFSFADKQPVKDVRANLRTQMLSRPKAIQKPTQFSIKALPINDSALSILPQLIGKTVDVKYLVANRLTGDRILGLSYSAQIVSQYIELEKEYTSRLSTAKPEEKQKLTLQWGQITKEAINQFSKAGLTVSPLTLNNWVNIFKKTGFNQTFTGTFKKALPVTDTKIYGPAGTVTASRTTEWLLAFPAKIGGIISDTIKAGLSDLCSKPLASGDFKKEWKASYDYNVNIPYWCPTWSDWTRTCRGNVTLFTFSLTLGIDIGYNITCCGGSCWATGSISACAGALGYNACVNCTAGGTAVVGVGKSTSAGSCTYGIGLNVSVNCSILGINIIEANYPIWGYTVTAPCPPAGFHCN